MSNKLFKYLLSVSFAIIFSPLALFAQHYDSQLAAEYLRKLEYDKASILYEQLYKEYGYNSYRNNYLRCLTEMEDYATSEKFIKKELKSHKNDPSLYVYLGNVYLFQEESKAASKEFEKAIEMAAESKTLTVNTANSFIMHRQFTYAETMYNRGAQRQSISYDYELANVYYYQHDYQRMIDKFLDLLIVLPSYLKNVQNRLQYITSSSLNNDLSDLLENSIISKIQEYPQASSIYELLIWQYSQTGRYSDALNQNIALDKRTNGSGKGVLEFGQILNDNQAYDLALEAFEYVIDLGDYNQYYETASIEYLNTLYSKVINTPTSTNNDLVELEHLLSETLSKVRESQSFSLLYALASVKAFYIDKTQEAVDVLKAALDRNRLNPSEQAECKLLYGDILLLNDNPWEATIVYAQVEKANVNNPYGHEARFRKAKLAYYTGQFQWAQAQLDVLKASTSKLIANDAFELSFFISENLELDSSKIAMQMFASADLLLYKHKDSLAILTLDSIKEEFPSHMLIDDILFRKAKIYEHQGNLNDAIEMFEQVSQSYSYDILADNSVYSIALIYDYKIKDKDLAMVYYEKMILEYPSSIYTVESRKRFRFLRGDNLENTTD